GLKQNGLRNIRGGSAFAAAAHLLDDYYLPMAERVYGDAAAPQRDRNAATLARWIFHEKPLEVHVRTLQREIRLPGMSDAEAIHEAAGVLVEADWLREPARGVGHRGKAAYAINPRIWEASS